MTSQPYERHLDFNAYKTRVNQDLACLGAAAAQFREVWDQWSAEWPARLGARHIHLGRSLCGDQSERFTA